MPKIVHLSKGDRNGASRAPLCSVIPDVMTEEGAASLACACRHSHLLLAYGGSADFRGWDAFFNFVSSPHTSVNVRIEESVFWLRDTLVNGTLITEAHVLARASPGRAGGRELRVSARAARLGANNFGWDFARISCGGRRWSPRVGDELACGGARVVRRYASLLVTTPEWNVTLVGRPVHGHVAGAARRIDLGLGLLRPSGPLHGLVGQSFDGSRCPRRGRMERYPDEGEHTTSANAEGAVVGDPRDYVVASPFATAFVFSTYGPHAPATAQSRRVASATSALRYDDAASGGDAMKRCCDGRRWWRSSKTGTSWQRCSTHNWPGHLERSTHQEQTLYK